VVVLPFVTSCREHVSDLLLEAMFPMSDLRGMYSIRTGSLIDGFVPL